MFRVKYTMVMLLEEDGARGVVPGMWVAGAKKMAGYEKAGSGRIFDSQLYHAMEKRVPFDAAQDGALRQAAKVELARSIALSA